jgi:hypothetical protein
MKLMTSPLVTLSVTPLFVTVATTSFSPARAAGATPLDGDAAGTVWARTSARLDKPNAITVNSPLKTVLGI